jgi:hypothetical protein
LHLLTRPAIPLGLSPQVSPSGWADGNFPILIGFSFHQPFRQSTPAALQAHQLNETVRPLNLWMQVQKPSKSVNFTKVSAERGFFCNAPRKLATVEHRMLVDGGGGLAGAGKWRGGNEKLKAAASLAKSSEMFAIMVRLPPQMFA